jgi:hypothetical protein
MCEKVQVVTEVGVLLVAIWAFGITFEPWRSRQFPRPLGRRTVVAMRIIAGLAVAGSLAVLVGDFFR